MRCQSQNRGAIPLNLKTRDISCNLCEKDKTSELWTKDGFHYVQCKDCGLVYVNPQLEPSEIGKIYSKIYKNKSKDKPPPKDDINYRDLLKWAGPYRKLNRFLDIGCFKGFLLAAARTVGWQPYGVEISEKAVQYAQNILGLNVYQSFSPKGLFPDEYFDVVVLFDVIEHLSDPLAYMKEIYPLIRPGGALYIFTPNFDSLMQRVLGKSWSVFFPWHQFYFSPKTLSRLLHKAGFTVKRIQCFGLGPLSTSNAYRNFVLTPGENSASQKIKFKLNSAFLRKVYFFLMANIHLPYGSKMTAIAQKP